MAEKEYTYLSVYAPKAQIKRWFDQLREAYEARGKTAPAEKIGLLIPIYVAETDTQAYPGNTTSLRAGGRASPLVSSSFSAAARTKEKKLRS
jgi:hypothetical protein